MIRDWTIIDRTLVNDFGIVQINQKRARSPRTGDVRDILSIDFPHWVLVLALTLEKEVVMVRQYRHGIERVCLELPGGLVDPEDPSPAAAAKRELLEETGYQSNNFVQIGKCYPQPAVLSNSCYVYLATDVKQTQAVQLDEGEDIEIVTVPLEQIPEKITKKEINHGMVLLAFFFYGMQNGPAAIRNYFSSNRCI
jgi:8-oxo-dGTP pyrophosphatase MutT (NUDIX family)